MHRIFSFSLNELRSSVGLILLVAFLGASFVAIAPIYDNLVQEEDAKENFKNIESLSISLVNLMIAIGGLTTVVGIIVLFKEYFIEILSMIKI